MDIILAIATTVHLGLAGEYNEVHPNVQLRFDNGIIAGAYHNSEDTVSVFAGMRGEWKGFFLEGGVVTGYEYSNVLPYGRAGYELTDNFSIFVAPAFEAIDDDMTVGAVLGVEYSIKIN